MREKTVGARRNPNGGRAAQAGDAFHLREEQPLPPIAGKGLEFVAGEGRRQGLSTAHFLRESKRNAAYSSARSARRRCSAADRLSQRVMEISMFSVSVLAFHMPTMRPSLRITPGLATVFYTLL